MIGVATLVQGLSGTSAAAGNRRAAHPRDARPAAGVPKLCPPDVGFITVTARTPVYGDWVATLVQGLSGTSAAAGNRRAAHPRDARPAAAVPKLPDPE